MTPEENDIRSAPTGGRKLAEFREEMEAYRRFVDEEARLFKDSYLALDRLHAMYQKFDSAERTMAHEVIAEWALSDDEGLRFDALALIDDFKIADEIPVLQKLRVALHRVARLARRTNYRK